MAREKRPTVKTNCVADKYTRGARRIIEFNANDGTGRGGLISFYILNDGTFRVEVYRTDGQVSVVTPREESSQ